MKSIISVALLMAGISTPALAKLQASHFGPKTTRQLSQLLSSDGAFYLEEQKNRVIYAAVVRCNSPEGTGNSKDKTSCQISTIEDANIQRERDAGKYLSINLTNALSKESKFYGETHQGWVSYAAQVICSDATDGSDKSSCEANAITSSEEE